MTQSQDVSVTVHSLGGAILLDSVKVSSIEELMDESAKKLKAKKCRMISADGNIIRELSHLKHCDAITAVAHHTSPLLQLVGLQSKEGDLMDETLPLEQLEEIAMQIAATAAQVACWFGGPQHLAGHPRIPWIWGEVLPAPTLFQNGTFLQMDHKTPVVHAGARVVLSLQEGHAGSTVREIEATRDLTVQDIVDIRSAYQDECDSMRSQLLSTPPGAYGIQAMMCLISYSAEEVCFQLSYRTTTVTAEL